MCRGGHPRCRCRRPPSWRSSSRITPRAFSDIELDISPLMSRARACVESVVHLTHSGSLAIGDDRVVGPTGPRVSLHGVTVAEFDGDRISSFRQYWDEVELLGPAGAVSSGVPRNLAFMDSGPLRVGGLVSHGVVDVVIDHPPTNLVDGAFVVGLIGAARRARRPRRRRGSSCSPERRSRLLPHARRRRAVIAAPTPPGADATGARRPHRTSPPRCSSGCTGARSVTRSALLDGAARGGGAEFLTAARPRYGSARAVLGQPEVAMGDPPRRGRDGPAARHLLGRSRALDVILTPGATSAPTRRCAIGWLDGVVPGPELVARAASGVRPPGTRRCRPPRSPRSKHVVDASLESFAARSSTRPTRSTLIATGRAHHAYAAVPHSRGPTPRGGDDGVVVMDRAMTDRLRSAAAYPRGGVLTPCDPVGQRAVQPDQRVDPPATSDGEPQRSGPGQEHDAAGLRLTVRHREQPHRRRGPPPAGRGARGTVAQRCAAGQRQAPDGHLPRLVDRRHPHLGRVTRRRGPAPPRRRGPRRSPGPNPARRAPAPLSSPPVRTRAAHPHRPSRPAAARTRPSSSVRTSTTSSSTAWWPSSSWMSIDTTSPSRSEITVATFASAPGRSGSSTRSRYRLIAARRPDPWGAPFSAGVSGSFPDRSVAANGAPGKVRSLGCTVLAAVLIPDPSDALACRSGSRHWTRSPGRRRSRRCTSLVGLGRVDARHRFDRGAAQQATTEHDRAPARTRPSRAGEATEHVGQPVYAEQHVTWRRRPRRTPRRLQARPGCCATGPVRAPARTRRSMPRHRWCGRSGTTARACGPVDSRWAARGRRTP